MRPEIMKLLFAYCEQSGGTDKGTILKALDRLGALREGMQDRWVRHMYRRRIDALRRSIQGGGTPQPDPPPRRDWGRRH